MKIKSIIERFLSLALYNAAFKPLANMVHANNLVDITESSIMSGDVTMIGGGETVEELNIGSFIKGNIIIDA